MNFSVGVCLLVSSELLYRDIIAIWILKRVQHVFEIDPVSPVLTLRVSLVVLEELTIASVHVRWLYCYSYLH